MECGALKTFDNLHMNSPNFRMRHYENMKVLHLHVHSLMTIAILFNYEELVFHLNEREKSAGGSMFSVSRFAFIFLSSINFSVVA